MNKIWNIDISQYKDYFSSKSVQGTKVMIPLRPYLYICIYASLILHSFINKICNFDISQCKDYLVASLS